MEDAPFWKVRNAKDYVDVVRAVAGSVGGIAGGQAEAENHGRFHFGGSCTIERGGVMFIALALP